MLWKDEMLYVIIWQKYPAFLLAYHSMLVLYKLFDCGRLAVALQYAELQAIFSSPPLKFQWRNVRHSPHSIDIPGDTTPRSSMFQVINYGIQKDYNCTFGAVIPVISALLV